MEIRSKREFFWLWEAGMLGNRTQLWRDPREAFLWGRTQKKGPYYPKIGFREIGKAGGGAWERVSWSLIGETAERWRKAGRTFICDDGVPNEKQTLLGEVCQSIGGLQGTLGITQLPMRIAMKQGLLRPCSGATVLTLVNSYMDPSSRDDLDTLLELYPEATIEFGCYSVDVGVIPHRNTMFWEVRNY